MPKTGQSLGPCRVLERLGEVVYRLHLKAPKGRRVALHRDRLAPYRGVAAPLAQGGAGSPCGCPAPPQPISPAGPGTVSRPPATGGYYPSPVTDRLCPQSPSPLPVAANPIPFTLSHGEGVLDGQGGPRDTKTLLSVMLFLLQLFC